MCRALVETGSSTRVSKFDVCTAMVAGFLRLMLTSISPHDPRSGQYQATALGRIAVQRGFIQVNSRAMTYEDELRSGRDLQNTPRVSPLANGCVCRATPINQASVEVLSMLEPQTQWLFQQRLSFCPTRWQSLDQLVAR